MMRGDFMSHASMEFKQKIIYNAKVTECTIVEAIHWTYCEANASRDGRVAVT